MSGRLTRIVHTKTRMAFGALSALAPDIVATRDDGTERLLNHALAFVDEDGECHLFVLAPEGVAELHRLTSPLILPPTNGGARGGI